MTFYILEGLKDILSKQSENCISVYMPIVPPGRGDEQNRIRLKNLLQQTEDELFEKGFKRDEAVKFLESARKLLNDPLFLRSQEKGLALFINENLIKYFFLPYEVVEKMTLGDTFFIKPLLPSFHGDGQYFILGLTKNNARLFSGSKYNFFEVDIKEVVNAAKKEISLVDAEKNLTSHSVTGVRSGTGAIFHGQDDALFEKDLIKQFFRLIEDGLKTILNKHNYPLVLVGVDYLLPIYKDVNKFKNIVETGIFGNPDDLGETKIHQRSWEIVEPIFNKDLVKDIESYNKMKGTGNTSDNIDEILPKAEYGQVDSLFIPLADKDKGDCNDHVNKVAVYTIKNGGTVYSLEQDEIFENAAVAAIFRY